uniref:Aminotransferase-like plant mobile domain-containing protein n=2 Tax=Solanum tuberosum TaxID=4113 RepID=M1CMJ9_SOLTU
MEMVAYPDLIGTMVKFWDSDNMVFRFGEVEMTPTIEEILASYESVSMCNKRRFKPDTDLLFPKTWDFAEIREKLSLVKADWMDRMPGPNIPLRKFYYRFGRARAYEKFKEEFVSEEKWKETRPLAFVICLLGTMVFPQGPNYTIHPNVVMVTHAIFYGVGYGSAIKYYTLAPMILADIYRALDKCQSGERFFQGCNLILQWWMMRHLIKAHEPTEPDPLERPNRLESHDWWVQRNHFNRVGGQEFWYPRLQGLRDENVQWSIQCLVVTKQMVIRAEKTPYLIFAGLRGTRPYAPGRVLRQLGGKQEIPQISDMKKFVTDHENGRVSFAEDIRRAWKTRRILGEPVPNRFRPECSKDHKEWLKKSLAGTIELGPNVPNVIADVGAKHQIRLHRLQERFDKNELDHQHRHSEDAKIIAQLKKELRRAKQCMSELDEEPDNACQNWIIAWSNRFSRLKGSDIKKGLGWLEITYGRTDMLCGKRSALPRGPDLVKDQDELRVCYHPLRGITLFVLCFVIYFPNSFPQFYV